MQKGGREGDSADQRRKGNGAQTKAVVLRKVVKELERSKLEGKKKEENKDKGSFRSIRFIDIFDFYF